MQVPLEMVAVPNLVALSSVVGRQLGIRPKKKDNWLVVPNLWGAVVARPGLLKSPAQDSGLRQVEILAAEATEEYRGRLAESLAEENLYKLKINEVKRRIKEALKKDMDAPVDSLQRKLVELEGERAAGRLTERRYKTNDPTVEKLGELMKENPNGLLLVRDELSGWMRSLEKEGREGDREFYLESWNGKGSYSVDRIGRGTIHIPALCSSIVGGIQPGKLEKYVAEALQGGWGDDGLLQRFQLLVYPEVNSDWTNVDREPDRRARGQASKVFRDLEKLVTAAPLSEEGIPALRFDSDAQEFFNNWRGQLETRLRSGEIDCLAFESHLEKYRSLMPALALLFELADNPEAESVGLDATRTASDFCAFLEQHARKVYAGAIRPDLQAAHTLAKRIKTGKVKDGTTIRDIYRNHWGFLNTPELVRAALDILEECGWIKTQTLKTKGRSTEILKLNPKLN